MSAKPSVLAGSPADASSMFAPLAERRPRLDPLRDVEIALDRLATHRFKADEAYRVGMGKGPVGAYLDIQGIVALAKEKAGGIMIWQVRGDAKGGKSLLRTIEKEQ